MAVSPVNQVPQSFVVKDARQTAEDRNRHQGKRQQDTSKNQKQRSEAEGQEEDSNTEPPLDPVVTSSSVVDLITSGQEIQRKRLDNAKKKRITTFEKINRTVIPPKPLTED